MKFLQYGDDVDTYIFESGNKVFSVKVMVQLRFSDTTERVDNIKPFGF